MGNATAECHTPRPARRVERPLDVDLFDARMRSRGFTTIPAQAQACGTDLRTMFRIRAGQFLPRLDRAFRMAEVAEAPLEALFPRPRTRRRQSAA